MQIRLTENDFQYRKIDCYYAACAIWAILFVCNVDYISKAVLGLLIVLGTILLLRKFINDRQYCIMIGVILYINLSLFYADCLQSARITLPIRTLNWQIYRNTTNEIQFLHGLLIFIALLNLLVKPMKAKIDIEIEKENNLIIYVLGTAFLWFAFFNGYIGARGNTYASNTTTLYEYAMLFYLITWYYSGKSDLKTFFLQIYSVCYVLQALMYGDRSSAIPMLLLFFVLYLKHISFRKVILLAVAGIVFSNAISVYRMSFSISDFISNYLKSYGQSSFASDTVSQSYYTGISIVALREIVDEKLSYFIDFCIGIIMGGSYGNANLSVISQQYVTNRGGGMIVSYFLFWFGRVGAVFIAIILAQFINRINASESSFCKLWKIYFIVMVFRWYLYTPFVLFRGIFFVFPVVYMFFYLLDAFIRNKTITLKL